MADQERPGQELTPGYYDHEFGDRVHKITKAGYAPPGPRGGGSFSGGGCLKGGGGIVLGVILVLRLIMSGGCRNSSPPNYYMPTYNSPTYRTPNLPPPGGFNNGNFNGGNGNLRNNLVVPNHDNDQVPNVKPDPVNELPEAIPQDSDPQR